MSFDTTPEGREEGYLITARWGRSLGSLYDFHQYLVVGRQSSLMPSKDERPCCLITFLWHHSGLGVGVPPYSLVRVEVRSRQPISFMLMWVRMRTTDFSVFAWSTAVTKFSVIGFPSPSSLAREGWLLGELYLTAPVGMCRLPAFSAPSHWNIGQNREREFITVLFLRSQGFCIKESSSILSSLHLLEFYVCLYVMPRVFSCT